MKHTRWEDLARELADATGFNEEAMIAVGNGVLMQSDEPDDLLRMQLMRFQVHRPGYVMALVGGKRATREEMAARLAYYGYLHGKRLVTYWDTCTLIANLDKSARELGKDFTSEQYVKHFGWIGEIELLVLADYCPEHHAGNPLDNIVRSRRAMRLDTLVLTNDVRIKTVQMHLVQGMDYEPRPNIKSSI